MWLLDQLAEQRITEAQQRGDFDDLPGAGQPLVLDDDSSVPSELRALYRVMRNAGYLPPELQLRGEIASVEHLLAAADDGPERTEHSRRFSYLLTRLNLSQAGAESLQVQQAYFHRLRTKLG